MMLALGAAFLSHTTEYAPEIFALLFGEVLGVSIDRDPPRSPASPSRASLRSRSSTDPLLLVVVVPEIAEARGVPCPPHGDDLPRSSWRSPRP